MGGSYAFSVIGYSGKNGGGGDTEDCRWTTAIKYRVNIGDWPVFGDGATDRIVRRHRRLWSI